ncbi:MAG: alpha/beta-hydrolase family protein [Pseudomonadota bacterium]
MTDTSPPTSHRWFHPLGLFVAVLFFTASLTPSLIPREAVMQGVLGGVVAFIGYHIGRFAGVGWRWLELPRPSARVLGIGEGFLLIIGAGILIFGLTRVGQWQDTTRAVMQLPPLEDPQPVVILATGVFVFFVLWLFFRLVGGLLWMIDTALMRILPRRIAIGLGLAATVWLVWALVDGVLLQRALRAADASFEAADVLIEPEIPQPTDPDVTGSDASLVEWDKMGRWGRYFVTQGPKADEIEAYYGPGAMDPVRVYIGRRSAEDAQARANLALAELIRTGGFERSTLVVVVPVGTGWMDPGGHDTLEFMTGGDVATVAVQYSYLTSALSLMVHPEYGVEQARVLFDTIYDHWTTLPHESRPKLYVHGLSQGSFNSQRTIRLYDMLGDPISGALWAGSPFLSPLWQNVRDGRELGSTEWQPQFGNGSLVRVINQAGAELPGQTPWGPVRMVFLHYPSDPIVAFTFDSAVQRPDWFVEPRAPDVSPDLQWFPIVTMFQLALDMAVSLQVEGYGHYYIGDDYIDAWALVLDPPDWSEERAAALRDAYDKRGPAF